MAQRSKPQIIKKNDNLEKEIGRRSDRAMREAAENTAIDLRNSLEFALNRFQDDKFKSNVVGWTGALYNSIEARNTEYSRAGGEYVTKEWGVVMWNYGYDLDTGSTGTTEIKPGTKLAKWAAAHELWGITSANSKRWTEEKKEITVKPHPFIDAGLANYYSHLKNALNNQNG